MGRILRTYGLLWRAVWSIVRITLARLVGGFSAKTHRARIHEWTDGQVWLVLVTDFPGIRTEAGLQARLLRDAKRAGVVLKTNRVTGGVEIQAVRPVRRETDPGTPSDLDVSRDATAALFMGQPATNGRIDDLGVSKISVPPVVADRTVVIRQSPLMDALRKAHEAPLGPVMTEMLERRNLELSGPVVPDGGSFLESPRPIVSALDVQPSRVAQPVVKELTYEPEPEDIMGKGGWKGLRPPDVGPTSSTAGATAPVTTSSTPVPDLRGKSGKEIAAALGLSRGSDLVTGSQPTKTEGPF